MAGGPDAVQPENPKWRELPLAQAATPVFTGGQKPTTQDERDEIDASCLDLIKTTVADEPGIFNVVLDSERRELRFEYDATEVSKAEVEQVARRLGPRLEDRFNHCDRRLDDKSACASCALTLYCYSSQKQARPAPRLQRAVASFDGAMLEITPDYVPAGIDRRPETAPSLQKPAAHGGVALLLTSPTTWLKRHLEVVFTAFTLIALIVGAAASRAAAPHWLPAVLYGAAYVTGGYFGTIAGLQSLRRGIIAVDMLMILAAIGAALVGAPFEGGLLLFLFSLSNVLQNYALDRTRQAIRALMKLRPTEALARRNGTTRLTPIELLTIGDHIVVRPGERVALDGIVVEGSSALDQSTLTGESIPVSKRPGDEVFAGTINGSGGLEVRVTRLARDSTIAKLIALVEEAQSQRAPTQRLLDRFEQYYAMAIIAGTALMIAVPPLVFGKPWGDTFYRAMTLMVVASPCALVISTPASILSAIANAARRGVLFKGGVHLENAANIRVVAFDKTGTLTEGKPQVTDVSVTALPMPALAQWTGEEDDVLALAAAVESKSEHPLAQAIVKTARHRGLVIPEATTFQAATGKGVTAMVRGIEIAVGNARHFDDCDCIGLEQALKVIGTFQDEGKTAVIVAWLEWEMGHDRKVAHILGVISIADVVRPDAAAVVRELKRQGVRRVVMLTGDNERVARAIAEQVGVDDYYADLLPADKVVRVGQLKDQGAVAMVGDGVNDAPALAAADIGIAMGAAGTDVALETADVVLMGDDLRHIAYAMALSRAARKVMIQNITFAVLVIAVLIAAALGLRLPLPMGVVGHEGSTVLVCLNGLRLLAFRMR